MEQALYHPKYGYYTDPKNIRTGKKGDFYTSVSVGEAFGSILAHRFYQLWLHYNSPSPFYLNEWGSENGQLARDILLEAAKIDSNFSAAIHYQIIEPLSQKKEHLSKLLSDSPQVKIYHAASQCERGCGISFSNEVFDALPVYLVRKEQDQWKEIRITLNENQTPATCLREISESSPLAEPIKKLPSDLPEHYLTEISCEYQSLIEEMLIPLNQGLFLAIDYGHSQGDYYHPARTEGTLRTYYRHTATDNPLLHLGEQDITAHVDFSGLLSILKSKGVSPIGFGDQAQYLTLSGKHWLLSLNPTEEKHSQLLRQFQTLTHPGHLGASFRCLEGAIGTNPPPSLSERYAKGISFLEHDYPNQ